MSHRLGMLGLLALTLLVACQPSAPVLEDQLDGAASSESSSIAEGTKDGNTLVSDLTKSSISFIGKSSLVDHPGMFESFQVTLTPDASDPSNVEKASIAATIGIASVKTDSKKLDGHLQKEDFFAADKHPNATFTSTSMTKNSSGTFDIVGDLTMKGITKQVTIHTTTLNETSLAGTFDLPRKEFGIGNDSYGDKLLDETIPITIKVTFK